LKFALAITQLAKSPPHLGQWLAFYLLPEHLEQSGDVTALTTTSGSQLFPDQDSGLETP
jgi:hypothetical protein